MKNLFFSLVLFFSLSTFAHATELVNCADSSGDSKVSFGLDGKFVYNLTFTYAGQVIAKYSTIKAVTNRFLGKIYYQIAFDGISYFDFERRIGDTYLEGAYLLTQNPVGLETNVTCTAH